MTYPDAATFCQRRQTAFSLLQTYSLKVLRQDANGPNTFVGSDGAQGGTLIPALAATLDQDGGDVIVALDLCNEINSAGPSTWLAGNDYPMPSAALMCRA